MNKNLKRCLEQSINREFVSVYHDYDMRETIYSIPYNASLAPRSVKLILIRAMGLDADEDFDYEDPRDIDSAAMRLIDGTTPAFVLASSHFINKNGTLMTHYTLDFDGEVLFERAYNSEKLNKKNPILHLMRKCSDKVISQERAAQEHKMEKMFISTNMFTSYAQHGRK